MYTELICGRSGGCYALPCQTTGGMSAPSFSCDVALVSTIKPIQSPIQPFVNFITMADLDRISHVLLLWGLSARRVFLLCTLRAVMRAASEGKKRVAQLHALPAGCSVKGDAVPQCWLVGQAEDGKSLLLWSIWSDDSASASAAAPPSLAGALHGGCTCPQPELRLQSPSKGGFLERFLGQVHSVYGPWGMVPGIKQHALLVDGGVLVLCNRLILLGHSCSPRRERDGLLDPSSQMARWNLRSRRLA